MTVTHNAQMAECRHGVRVRSRIGQKPDGFSLVELMVVVTILGILATIAAPRYAIAVETAKLDICSAQLRSIWLAQRMHWLETHTYASTFDELRTIRSIDNVVATIDEPYAFEIVVANATGFEAQATRAGSVWDGTLNVDETGVIYGEIKNRGRRTIRPVDR